jgi:hypothetical protein
VLAAAFMTATCINVTGPKTYVVNLTTCQRKRRHVATIAGCLSVSQTHMA